MKKIKLTFLLLKNLYAVCRLDSTTVIPDWAKSGEFCSITKTPDELSVVCIEDNILPGAKCEKGWRILKIQGLLDFALTGILASAAATLANQNISIFAFSTFNTDYILVKEEQIKNAITALEKAGHTVMLPNKQE